MLVILQITPSPNSLMQQRYPQNVQTNVVQIVIQHHISNNQEIADAFSIISTFLVKFLFLLEAAT